MIHCKTLTYALLGAGLFLASSPSCQELIDLGNIDSILQDSQLEEAASRYSSVLSSFFPERATRLGFSSANTRLNDRSPQQNRQALVSLREIQTLLETQPAKELSPAKQTDRQLLLQDLYYTLWEQEQNRPEHDPLYYAEALDALYDVRVKEIYSAHRQRAEITARLLALPAVAEQAEKYLTDVNVFRAQLAMEKAYYAFLSMNDLADFLAAPYLDDPEMLGQIKRQASAAKQAIKRMFDLFKNLSQQQNARDLRLGETDYTQVLAHRYQINQKPAKLLKQLQTQVQQAQTQLTRALEPFDQNLITEEVTVADELEDHTSLDAPAQTPALQGLRNAQDFYAVTKQIVSVTPDENPVGTLQKDAANLAEFFKQVEALPNVPVTFQISPMPQYYTYTNAYLFVPPYGQQFNPRADFYLRLPSGNNLAKQQQLDRDFNLPTRKLMLSGELVPGRYLQTAAGSNLSTVRKLYPSATLANGWSAYAQKMAQEQGYIIADDELLFLAWAQYLRALEAYTDAKLHTRQFSYAQALDFLTKEHGLETSQAEQMLKQMVLQPGNAVSYQVGLETLQQARAKYQKKLGKKFSLADFHARLLQIGNVPPDLLDKELALRYKKETKK